MSKYYYCIDVGGTEIKGGVIDEQYQIICTEQISSITIKSNQSLHNTIVKLLSALETKCQLPISSASGIGMGLPGLVNTQQGTIELLPNLKIKQYNIVNKLQEEFKIPIKIANDAELALLAEHRLGSGKNHDNFALITLGTGLGLGLMINGKPLRASLPFSSEYGHNIINSNGDSLESLVSAKALLEQIKLAMINNRKSKLWSNHTEETIDIKTFFDYIKTDKTASAVFDCYISNLGRCLVNLYNVLSPSIIVIGGGISKQGKTLTKPLEEFVNKNIFLKNINIKTHIVPATFLNEAGILGARCLFD